jgi:sigma-B regulation protein RsbU (phosphoserine phosphatase)
MSDYLANFKDRQKNDISEINDVDRRLIELSALFEISQTLNSSLNLQSILNNVLLVPMGRMMIGKGIIFLKKNETEFRVETLKGLSHSLLGKEITFVDLPKHIFFLKDFDDAIEWVSIFKDFKLEIIIPFISRTDTLGLMGFSAKLNGQSFTEEEIEFLNSLSNIATTSIENALVFEKIQLVNRELDHKIQELNTLFDIGKELNLTFERDKILKLLSYALMGQVTVNNYLIALREDEEFSIALVKGSKFTMNEGEKCDSLCKNCGFVQSPYLREDNGELDDYLSEMGVSVIIPMQIQKETKGFIFLGDKITGKAYTPSDLEFLQTLGNIAIISIENARLFQEALEKQRLEEEMALARIIQNRLLPKKMPKFNRVIVDGLNVPSKHVGGDYFDIIKISDSLIGVTIADVSGKGMPASLLMSNLQASLHSLIYEKYDLDHLVGRINNVIFNNTDTEKYITFFYGQLDLNTLELSFVNAGHNPPYLIHKNKEIDELSDGGIILGMMPNMPYKIGSCKLQHGDTLLMYTDGVTETMTKDDEEYEEQRLKKFMDANCSTLSPEQINQALIQELTDFANGAQQSDDITILTLKIV